MRLNKSFARRVGKSLSPLQQSLLKEALPQCLFDPLTLLSQNKYIAEIGIGMGDHFVMRAQEQPDALHIGFEPYLNGIANSLKLIKAQNITNIMLWPDDVDLVIDQIPNNLLSALYILFPDPWPKLHHHKRRIINETRVKVFASKLQADAMLYFASDIKHYFCYATDMIRSSGLFHEISISSSPYDNYIKTKYHIKAEAALGMPQFLCARKLEI